MNKSCFPMIIGGKACCLLSPRSPHRWRALLSRRWSGSLPKSQWRLQLIVEQSLYPLFLSSAEMSVPDLRRDKKVQTHPYLLPPPPPPFFTFACNLKVAVFLASAVSRPPYFLISRCPSLSVSLSPPSPSLLAVSSPILSLPLLSLSLSSLPPSLSLVVSTPQLQPLSHHFRRVPGAALTTSNHRSN